MAELVGLMPPLTLGWLWLGAEGAALALLSGLPIVVRGRSARAAAAAPAKSLDALSGTGLRTGLTDFIDQVLADQPKGSRATACFALRLDDGMALSERFGPAIKDQVLQKVAVRIGDIVRQRDFVARIGGDTFAIALAPGRQVDLEAAIQISDRLVAAIREPMSIESTSVYTTASVGFCLASRAPEAKGTALLAAAEAAMEDAWRQGPGSIRAFSPETPPSSCGHRRPVEELQAALENGEIIAHFQPQISTDTGAVTGMEALARWRHPLRGLLPPAEFLPLVQTAGLSTRLSEVMLFNTLTALRAWDRAGYRVPTAGVNFSHEELRDPKLGEKLQWELDRFDLPPDRLTVEILESVVAETASDAVVHTISGLARMGCGIDLDDFGTGHASITSIRRFAVNRIKIDRSFVIGVDRDPDQQRMVAAILSMADQLGLQTLAEGVETAGEHAMLAQLGCSHVQGYSIARPMPFEETIAWLERHQSKLRLTPTLDRKIG